jgi:hypothetical protein
MKIPRAVLVFIASIPFSFDTSTLCQTGHLESAQTLRSMSSQGTVDASIEPGSTADAKIMAACAALPPAGGTVETCGFGATVQTIASPVSCGGTSRPVAIHSCAATTFVPISADTQMFLLVDGMSMEGTLSADVTGVPGWNGAVITNVPTARIPENGTTKTRIGFVHCWGRGTSTGDCIRLRAESGGRVTYVSVAGMQVDGMASGVHLDAEETSAGNAGWVNGNWFYNILCNGTQKCMHLEANGTVSSTQVSQNHFIAPQVELLGISGLRAIDASATGGAVIYFDDFEGLTPFDAATGTNIISLGSNTQGLQVKGFLCLYSCGGGTASDIGSRNVTTDWYVGQLNTDIPIMNSDGTRQAYIATGNTGAEFDLSGGNDLRIYSGNSGLGILGGSGSDHNLYLNSLDSSGSGKAVFNSPVNVGNGVGSVQLNPGDDGHTGRIAFLDSRGEERGSIGGNAVSQNYLDIYSPTTTRHYGNFSVNNGSFELNGVGGTILTQGTPASSRAACVPPAAMYDKTYIYICVASNVWRRTAMSSF